jgi:MFS family permease
VQLINSASYGFLQPAMLAYVRDNTPEPLQSTAITMITALATSTSGIFGNYIAGIMIESWGMNTTFHVLGAIAIAGTGLFLLGDRLPQET